MKHDPPKGTHVSGSNKNSNNQNIHARGAGSNHGDLMITIGNIAGNIA